MTKDYPYTNVTITTAWMCDNCEEDHESTDEFVDNDQVLFCEDCGSKFRALIR